MQAPAKDVCAPIASPHNAAALAAAMMIVSAKGRCAARNLAPNKWVLWITRRYLEIARTVPELVWALIFVFCFSVGPFAGVLAI